MKFRQNPEDILKRLGIYNAEDIDLDLVAYSLGAEVKYSSLIDCEGNIVGTNTNAIITINKDVGIERQRFSLGHELGHWVNDRNQNLTYRCAVNDMRQREFQESNFRQQREVRANQFSAELLVPKYIVKPLLDSSEINFELIRKLADIFTVSVTSMAIRVVELSKLPCMLICWTKEGKRRWFIQSEIIPCRIWPHKQINNFKDFTYISGAMEVDADTWIDGEDADNFTLIQSVFSNSYGVLTLLWWKDESQILEMC